MDENVLATGDDTGGIRLWDQRKEGPLMDMRQHEEYIADMALDPAKKLLLTARYSLKAASPPFRVKCFPRWVPPAKPATLLSLQRRWLPWCLQHQATPV